MIIMQGKFSYIRLVFLDLHLQYSSVFFLFLYQPSPLPLCSLFAIIPFKFQYFYNCIQQIVLQQPHHCMNGPKIIDFTHNKQITNKAVDFRAKYKTQKCRYWTLQGFCPFGQMCAFAHDCQEMRYKGQIHQHYKTKLCANFTKFSYCKYGERCLFLHKEKGSDRQRTRSNSPIEQSSMPRILSHHQQNLKILTQFGLSVFEAHLKRRESRLKLMTFSQQCDPISESTEPEAENIESLEINQNYSQLQLMDYEFESMLKEPILWTSESKKQRMYSM